MRIYFLLIVFVLAGCTPNEEPVEQVVGAPVFYMKGTINGRTINLLAGVNNYAMKTVYETDSSGVVVFGGVLTDTTCADCPALSIAVRNYTGQSSFKIDSAFYEGMYDFYNRIALQRTYYEASFIAESDSNAAAGYDWLFGNGLSAKGKESGVRYRSSGTYQVTLTGLRSSDQCSNQITQTVKVPSLFNDQYAGINVNKTGNMTLLFNSIPVDQGADITWDFGDGTTGRGAIVSHTFDSPQVYQVCMTFRKDSNSATYCSKVNLGDPMVACVSNFKYKVKTVIDPLQLSGVVVEWKDEAGKLYSSSGVAQPDYMQFEVLERSEYIPVTGQGKTVKVKMRFSCRVSDGINTLDLEGMEATWAFRYP